MMSFPGEEVDRQLCRDAIFPIPVACDVPCPRDCVLSMWSAWSSCSHTCSGKTTEGKQTRARSILAYAGEEGKVSSLKRNSDLFQKLLCLSLCVQPRYSDSSTKISFPKPSKPRRFNICWRIRLSQSRTRLKRLSSSSSSSSLLLFLNINLEHRFLVKEKRLWKMNSLFLSSLLITQVLSTSKC